MERQHDLIVVGAGWHGLVAAKTYIDMHPEEDVVVLEAESSVGGTWSAERLYPGLKSNNLLDSYEYPDFPMTQEIYGVKPNEHIPGSVLHRYLADYATNFGVMARTRFRTRVDTLEPSCSGGWKLEVAYNGDDDGDGNQAELQTLWTRRIIIATGLTSQPNLPIYPGAADFGGPYFHSRDFYRHSSTVFEAKNVVVVGGGKSAFDLAYACATQGQTCVDLVIRSSGNGPVCMSYPWIHGGKARLEEMLSVRWMTWFSPCAFGGIDGFGWVRSFLHGTAVGRFLVDKFWAVLGREMLKANQHSSHPELEKLRPWHPAFWMGSGLGIHNYDGDFFDLVRRGRIKVHIGHVKNLSRNTVHLDIAASPPADEGPSPSPTPVKLHADALVCATGWRKEPSIHFLGSTTPLDISGLYPDDPGHSAAAASAAALISSTDARILSLYPRLRFQPALNSTQPSSAAAAVRLHRFIAPPSRLRERDLAFAGLVSSASTATTASLQALWISAFFDRSLERDGGGGEEEGEGQGEGEGDAAALVADETMLHTQWARWRYPCGDGVSLPGFVFDGLPYLDLLLSDLGLRVRRKGTLWKELTEPYTPRDYVGLVGEWGRKGSREIK